ncbi:heme-binding protein 1-like [Panulirus ornatus]|uniref:heme-binding protein 1-like n=1 Tax=Panulirus ornatus TaxID=150431 RepID=UPI003A8A1B04
MALIMLRLALVVVVLVSAGVTRPCQAATLFSAFARALGPQEEAPHTVVHQYEGFEERLYPAKKWACTKQNGSYSTGDQIDVFLRLFGYIGGDNSKGEKLVMGTPVSVECRTEEEHKVYSACFFIPEAAQADPPAPTNPRVVITSRPDTTVFTRKFGGYAQDEDTWNKEAEDLSEVLTEAGKSFTRNLVFWNAYDPPFKFWKRRNEVWLVRQ